MDLHSDNNFLSIGTGKAITDHGGWALIYFNNLPSGITLQLRNATETRSTSSRTQAKLVPELVANLKLKPIALAISWWLKAVSVYFGR